MLSIRTWTCSLLVAASAAAQSERVLRHDNVSFARELLLNGYPEMAEQLCDAIVKSGKGTKQELLGVQPLLLDLRQTKAAEETDPAKKKELLEEVLKEKQKFIAANPNSPEAEDAINNLPDLHRLLGDTLATMIKAEKDPNKAAALRQQGKETFTNAEDALRLVINKLKDTRSDDPNKVAQQETKYANATYNLARMGYFHAQIYEPGSPDRKQLLERSYNDFDEFAFTNDGTLLCFEGYMYQGLCQQDLGDEKKALAKFDEAIKLREAYTKNAKGQFEFDDPAAQDIVARAALRKLIYLKELKKYPEGVAAAEDFFATIPDPLSTGGGMQLLAAEADLQLEAKNTEEARKLAKRLQDADPGGVWGNYGRELLGRMLGEAGGEGLPAPEILRIAQEMATRGELDKSVDAAQKAIAAAKPGKDGANIGSGALLLIGSIQTRKGDHAEALKTFESAGEKYPEGDRAAACIWEAAKLCIELGKKDPKGGFVKRRQDLMDLLAKKWPSSPYGAYADLLKGQALEAEEKWEEAAKLYAGVPAGGASYEQAQFRAGYCLSRQARKLLNDKKTDDAKRVYGEAEKLLANARSSAEASAEKTLDKEQQVILLSVAFSARVALANIYLSEAYSKPQDANKVLEGIEEKYPGDSEKAATTWGLRIQALLAENRLDEAISQLDTLTRKDPNSRGAAAAAGVIARALDAQSEAARAKGDARAADELWKKAARYYFMSLQHHLKTPPTDLAVARDMDAVAGRLFTIGAKMNGLPDDDDSFVGRPAGSVRSPEFWNQAIQLWQVASGLDRDYRILVHLGRTHGLLGKWPESVAVYRKLFERESDFVDAKKQFNPQSVRSKPELVRAYLEWGVGEHQNALVTTSKEDFERAFNIYTALNKNAGDASKLWWQAKYFQIRLLMDSGDYPKAEVLLNDVERGTNDFDEGKFGYKAEFLKIKKELATKLFRPGGAPAPAPGGGGNAKKQGGGQAGDGKIVPARSLRTRLR